MKCSLISFLLLVLCCTVSIALASSCSGQDCYVARCALQYNTYYPLSFSEETCDDLTSVCYCSCLSQCFIIDTPVYAQCYNLATDTVITSSSPEYSNCTSVLASIPTKSPCYIDSTNCPATQTDSYGNITDVIIDITGAEALNNATINTTQAFQHLSTISIDYEFVGSPLANITFTLRRTNSTLALPLGSINTQVGSLFSFSTPLLDINTDNGVLDGFFVSLVVTNNAVVYNSTEFSISTYCVYQNALQEEDSTAFCSGMTSATCDVTANACTCPSYPDFFTEQQRDCSCAAANPSQPTECSNIVQTCSDGSELNCAYGWQELDSSGACFGQCICSGLWSGDSCDECNPNICGSNGVPSDDCSSCVCAPGYVGTNCSFSSVAVGIEFESTPSDWNDTSEQVIWLNSLLEVLADLTSLPIALINVPTNNYTLARDSIPSATNSSSSSPSSSAFESLQIGMTNKNMYLQSELELFSSLSMTIQSVNVTSDGLLRVGLALGYTTDLSTGLPSRTQVMQDWTSRVSTTNLNQYAISQTAGQVTSVTAICPGTECTVYSYGHGGKIHHNGLGLQVATIVIIAAFALTAFIFIFVVLVASSLSDKNASKREKQPMLEDSVPASDSSTTPPPTSPLSQRSKHKPEDNIYAHLELADQKP